MVSLACCAIPDRSVLTFHSSFSNYGGAPVKAEYCHEAVRDDRHPSTSLSALKAYLQALRLVLHTLATSAARYGRHIQPLLSLSIDFYVRLFVRVQTSPIDVKRVFRYVIQRTFGCDTSAKADVAARPLFITFVPGASPFTSSRWDV